MLLSQDELARTATINSEIAACLAENPRPTPDYSDHKAMRNSIATTESQLKSIPAPAGVSETYHDIPMRDGFASSVKICKPTSRNPGPLIVLCFGGGFIGGSNEQFTLEARALVQLFGATVVSISYRLGPEHKFPFSQHDAWDSCKWIAANATDPLLNADPSKGFLLGGVSAGGALTASLSRKFQEEPLAYPLTGQWLAVPSIMDSSCLPAEYKSYYIANVQNANTVSLSEPMREAIARWVAWDSSSDLRYAINSKTDIAGQPKTYFQVDGMDPLRDDALIYDELLHKAGVHTKVDLYSGCPHAHWAAMPNLTISKKCRVDAIVGFGWLLGKDVSRAEVAKTIGIVES